MNLYDEFSAIVKAFQKKKIRFAVVGGLAMAFYDEPRFTRDIDILLHSDDEENMVKVMNKRGYFESAKPWSFSKVPIMLRRFVKTQGEDYLPVDILVGKDRRIDEIVERATDQAWSTETVKVAKKEDIIWLKRGRGSDQDKIDIRKLKK